MGGSHLSLLHRGGGGFGNSDTPRQGEGGGLKILDFGFMQDSFARARTRPKG